MKQNQVGNIVTPVACGDNVIDFHSSILGGAVRQRKMRKTVYRTAQRYRYGVGPIESQSKLLCEDG